MVFGACFGASTRVIAADGAAAPTVASEPGTETSLQIEPGDEINIQVYGQPDMTSNTYVSDTGEVRVALAGAVHIAGLSPALAAQRIETALRDGHYLLNPHVTITISSDRRISVIGEVKNPGRYTLDANATVLDLLASAGGTTNEASDNIYVLRREASGETTRLPVNLRGLLDESQPVAPVRLRPGDSVLVPRAAQFRIYGEVKNPSTYRLQTGMRVFEALALAGGVTERGSRHRIEIQRKQPDGSYKGFKAKLDAQIEPGDVIRVKESIF